MLKRPKDNLYRLWLYLIFAVTLIYIASFVAGLGIEIPLSLAKTVCKTEINAVGIAESYILPLVPIIGAGFTSSELLYLGVCINYGPGGLATPVLAVIKGVLACMIALLFAVPTADSVLFFAALILHALAKTPESKSKTWSMVKSIGVLYAEHVALVIIILLILTLLTYAAP
ncbi:MAG: hypothetical protein GXO23_03060 [Crenarchaeota archaeon]|nr:hypothetical protein [Thermoproteota archaeon]